MLFKDFWQGWDTLDGLKELATYQFCQRFLVIPDYLIFKFTAGSVKIGSSCAHLLSLAFFLFVSWTAITKVKDPFSLLYHCGWISWLYLMFVSPVYWPWYVLMPIALMATTPTPSTIRIVMITTLCSRIAAPYDLFYRLGYLKLPGSVFGMCLVGLYIPIFFGIWMVASPPSTRPLAKQN